MKTKKCKYCNESREKEGMLVVQMSSYCNFECAINHGIEKSTASRERKERRDTVKKLRDDNRSHQVAKFRVKPYTKKMTELQSTFNKLQRLREFKWFKDRGLKPTCITCQKELGGDQWCNGHYLSRGARPDLALDRVNSYLQHNKRCNQMLSSPKSDFENGLRLRFGNDAAQEIIDYCATVKPTKKYSDEEIKQMMKDFRGEIRGIEAEIEFS